MRRSQMPSKVGRRMAERVDACLQARCSQLRPQPDGDGTGEAGHSQRGDDGIPPHARLRCGESAPGGKLPRPAVGCANLAYRASKRQDRRNLVDAQASKYQRLIAQPDARTRQIPPDMLPPGKGWRDRLARFGMSARSGQATRARGTRRQRDVTRSWRALPSERSRRTSQALLARRSRR